MIDKEDSSLTDQSSSVIQSDEIKPSSDEEVFKPKVKKKSVLSKLAKRNFFIRPNFVLSDSDDTGDCSFGCDYPNRTSSLSSVLSSNANSGIPENASENKDNLNTTKLLTHKSDSNLISLDFESKSNNSTLLSLPLTSTKVNNSVSPKKLPKIKNLLKSEETVNQINQVPFILPMQHQQTPVVSINVSQNDSPKKLFVKINSSKTDGDSDSTLESHQILPRRFSLTNAEDIAQQNFKHFWNFSAQSPAHLKNSIKRLHETSSSGDEPDVARARGHVRKAPLISWTRPLDSDNESPEGFKSHDPVSEFRYTTQRELNGRSPKHRFETTSWKVNNVASSFEYTHPNVLLDNLSLKNAKGKLEPLFPKLNSHSDDSSLFRVSSLKKDSFNISGSHRSLDTYSDKTTVSLSVLPQISTHQARSRSYLQGNISTNGLLGSNELDRYFPDRRIRIFVGTWNMGDQQVPESLNDFLLSDYFEYVPDIYAIGIQEGLSNRKEWEIKMQETIGPSHVLFFSAMLGVLHQAVFIRRDLIWFVSIPEHSVISTRPGTMVKTKGAVAISFTFFGTSFLFITSHLTAHESKIKERISDYEKIIHSLDLPKSLPINPYSGATDVTGKFDCVFWCGDLNFRIEKERNTVETLLTKISANEGPKFEELILSDQLSKLMSEEKVFKGFQEGRINFPPSYKYDIGTSQFDTSHKQRTPSYTDRVLFKSKKKNNIICIQYNCVPTIKTSDHRPVYALFEVTIRPGRDNIPLGAGTFNREVFVEASRRRGAMKTANNEKQSTVCVIQ